MGGLDRAYSVFKQASISDERWEITGIASTPAVDSDGDILDPEGAQFSLPLSLLERHDQARPLGQVVSAQATKDGIRATMRIRKPEADTPPALAARLTEAWHNVKLGLVRGLSVGFLPVPGAVSAIKETGGRRFSKWNWYELSLVTIPANQQATILSIKSAALRGPQAAVSLSAVAEPHPLIAKGSTMNIPEALQSAEAKRAATVARMHALMKGADDEKRTLNEEEGPEYDSLQTEISGVDAHIKRLKTLAEQPMPTAPAPAAPVAVNNGPEPLAAAAVARSTIVPAYSAIRVKSNLPVGIGFTRYVIAKACSRGSMSDAMMIAQRWKDTPEVAMAIKAAMEPGTTTDATWAGPLVQLRTLSSEFIELVRNASILGRIMGMRRVPFNVQMARQTAGSTVGWVGQGLPKPVSELAFDLVNLGMFKCAGIVVLTQELARSSDPAAEAVVTRDLTARIGEFTDAQFITPSVAGVAGVSPASVTNGVTAIPSSGATMANIMADASTAMGAMAAAGLDLAGATWIMNTRTALHLTTLRTALDVPAFPGAAVTGGTFMGLPVVVSNTVPITAGSPSTTIIVLVNAPEIFLADDGGVDINVSSEASVQMSSTPAEGAAELVSFWQNNLIGVRAERFINWLKRNAAAAQYISGVTY